MTTHQRIRLALGFMTVAALSALRATMAAALPPTNDSFAAAAAIDLSSLPFSNTADMTEATTEPGELLYCSFSTQTVWYKFTPATNTWLGASTAGSALLGTSVTVWSDSTGSGPVTLLGFVGCSSMTGSVQFLARAGITYYLQACAPCCFVTGSLRLNLDHVSPPAPVASFFYYPVDPSRFDTIQFDDSSYDPGTIGIQSQAWEFGDGATATGCCPSHRYGADGDYTAHLRVTTYDGRTKDTTGVVSVRTRDVAIVKFRVPESAAAGQTRQITVGVSNTRYPELVRVELYKSVAGAFETFELVNALELPVPVRTSNRTTDFDFSYTFTHDDATLGKMSFEAIAFPDTARDAFPADNLAISSPVKLSRKGPAHAASEASPVAAPVEANAPLALLKVTPNPMRADVDLAIRLSVPAGGPATLQVLDVAGRVVMHRSLEALGPGVHEMRFGWEHKPAPGLYWVRLTQSGKTASMRIGVLQ